MRPSYAVAIIMSAFAGIALAKLPPPTPEEQEAAAHKKQVDAEKVAKQKEELERAQNRVVEYYKRTKGAAAAGASKAAGSTETTNVSRKAVEGRGTAAPRGGTNQSAEAHSAPAK
jgi:hypothetical protein